MKKCENRFLYFSRFFHCSVLAKSQQVKNYNLNVTEVQDSDFKKCFSRNFQFHRRDPNKDVKRIFDEDDKNPNLFQFQQSYDHSLGQSRSRIQ